MGVNLNFYTYYGVRTPWIDKFSEDYNDVYEALGYKDPVGVDVVMDGMSGEFMVFGIRLWDSGDARYGFEGSTGDAEIDVDTLEDERQKYIDNFAKVFPDHAHLLDKKWNIHSFAYYH